MIKVLEISYPVWKELVSNNGLAVFDIHETETTRVAFAGSRAMEIVWRTFVCGDDFDDFAARFEDASIPVLSENDALALIIGLFLGAIPTIQEVRPNLYPDGITLTFPGRGDDPTDGRMLGPRLQLERSTDGDEELEFGFNDQITISGGSIRYSGAQLGDWVRFDVNIPATPTPPTSGGTLNCTRVEIVPSSGLYTIVPVPAQYATHFLDLSDPTKWNPVPAQKANIGTQKREPDGFWEWSYPATGKGSLAARPAQNGWWSLYEFPIAPVARFVPDANLLGDGAVSLGTAESLRPQVMLPHWKFKITLHNEGGSHDLKFVVEKLHVGRYKPQPGNG